MHYFKKNILSFITSSFLLLGMSLQGYSQLDMANNLITGLNNYSQQHLQEKIFAHTDKSFYVCGEIVWFKLYNVDAYSNRPLDISKIAYVELLSNDKKPVLQARVELREGAGNGSFILPFSLNSGSYILRAYTNWMKNYSPDLFFETGLTVINTLKKLTSSGNETNSYDIQFFPEGGNMVNGMQSKVAFHAVDQSGRSVSCKGTVYNQKDEAITSFQSLRFGMGNFNFTPVKGDSYTARIESAGGQKISHALPAAYESGYVMKLTPSENGTLRVTVSSGNNNEPVFLLVHTRQSVKLAESKMIKEGTAEFVVSNKNLGEGISHFTVFNYLRKPVCERLYFYPPKEKLNLQLITDLPDYTLRKKVNVRADIGDSTMLSGKTDLSISVFRVDSLQSIGETDIQSYLWLSSELKGTIESPSWYFTSLDKDKDEATDNLMLTQGWSRFKWEDVESGQKPVFKFLPEYEGPLVTGRVIAKSSGLPTNNITAYLTVPGEKFVFKSTNSDQQGAIRFNLNKFYGSSELIVQLSGKLKNSYSIDMDPVFAESFSSRKYPANGMTENWQDQLLSYSINTQVENTFVQDKKQKFYHYSLSDTTSFFGHPDKTYWLDDYTRFITMEEVMREYVPEVRVRKQQEQLIFKVKNQPYQVFFENEPLVLLDGLPIFDMNKLMEFDPLKIKKLEVVSRKFISGNDAIEGIVSYATYKGNLDGFQIDPAALVLEYQGLQLEREFSSPVYATKEQVENRLPDFRNLLYWSPDITTDATGKRQASFYTSDRPGRYAVVVQGINSNGIAGSKVIYFTVRK